MSDQNHYLRHANETIEVLRELSETEPRKYQATSTEEKAKKASNWCLVLAGALLIILGLLIYLFKVHPDSAFARTFVIAICVTSIILSLLALIIPVAASLLMLSKWKSLSFTNLCDDISYEFEIAGRLCVYSQDSLTDAQYWINRKINRISARTTRFFGKETAVIGIITAAFTLGKDFGIWERLFSALATGVSIDNIGDTLIVWVAAFLVGMSIGVMLLNQVVSRYRYQLELLELATRVMAVPAKRND